MGSAIGAFAQGIQGTLGKKLEDKHQEEEQLKGEQRQALYKVIFDPSTSDAGRQMAQEQLQKLLNPTSKKGFAKIAPQLGQIFKRMGGAQGGAQGGGGQQPQPQGQPQAAQPAPAPTPGGQAPMSESLGMPAGTKLPPPTSPRAQFNKGPDFAAMMQGYGDKAQDREKAMAAYRSQLKIQEEQAKPVKPSTASEKRAQLVKSYMEAMNVDEAEAEKQVAKMDVKEAEEGKPTAPRIISNDVVTLPDAKSDMEKNGTKYYRPDGTEINLDNVARGQVLQHVQIGKKSFYVPKSVADKSISIGGVEYAVSPYEMQDLPKGAGTTLGPKNAQTQTQHDIVTIDPVTGKAIRETVYGQRNPQATGIPGRPGDRGAARPAPAPTKENLPITPATPPATRQNQPVTGATPQPTRDNTAGTDPRELRGLPSGNYNQTIQRAIPVREAAVQIFGDGGLKDYAKLADDPKSRERLGTALRLTFDGLNNATAGAHLGVGVSAGPVSLSTGGFGDWLTASFGVPAATAQAQQQMMEKAFSKLTPQEKEAYDAVMSSFSTVVGLRSLTKASAAGASVAAIERELPVIGVNTFDSKQFADQMSRLAGVVSTGFQSVPKGMVDKNLIDQVEKFRKKGPAKAPSSGKSEDLKGKSTEDLLRMLAQ